MATHEPQETLEYRIFRDHYDRLIHSIQDPLPLATRLFIQGVIKYTEKEHMSVFGLSTLDKNSALLSAVKIQIQLDPKIFYVFLSSLNEDPSLQSLALVESMQRFVQPSGMLQPSGYQIPPPQHMHSGVGGHHSAFIPSQHLQQELAPPSGMMQSSAYQIPPLQHLYSRGGGPTFTPTNFHSSWQGVAPPNLQYPLFQHLYSGIGGHLPTFMPFQHPQQGFATPHEYLPQNSGVCGYQSLCPQYELQEKLLKTLRKSIKESNVDSFHRHLEELERLLQNSKRMKELLEDAGVLCYGAFVGSNPVVETLLQKGVDINAKSAVPGNLIKWSPLHWAAREGHVNTVKRLVENGAEVNSEDHKGMTPLHCAALKCHFGTLQYLVGAGANINVKDKNGWTPLYCAALEGHADIVQVLMKKGADINVKNNGGETPKDVAAKFRCEAVVAYFKRAADLNLLRESESTGRQEEQRLSPEETDNSCHEEPPGTPEKQETEECDHEEIDLQLENLLEKYRRQPTIKHKSLKCLFAGPPRVGKTTLKKRLLRMIKNLITSGVVSPSGGLEKPISVTIDETKECVTVVMESDLDWKPQQGLLDEAQIVLDAIDKIHHQIPQSPGPKCPLPKHVPPTPVSTTVVPSTFGQDPPTPREGEIDTLDDAKKLMQEVLSNRKLHTIKDIEKTTTLYFMDTGGQPEFQEIMPIILNGPALHLVFFNLTINLDDSISIQFCHQDGTDSVITYNSSYTEKEMIFQLLSSLYYLSKQLSPDSESGAVLIGTHFDQLKDQEGQGDRKIEEINDSLRELFSNAEFLHQAFLTYPKQDEKSTIFIPVNNYSGDEEEIKQLQAFLRQVIDNRFGTVQLPSSWLFFHLILRHRYENSTGVCTLADCRALAKGCGLDENDVPQVLRYIHQYLGTILYYEEVQGLNELVICDPNVLFRGIYQLVAVSFGGDEAQHTITTEIRRTGEISERVLKRIGTQPRSSLLTNEHIIELLKHFKILTEFHRDENIAYFMPCLLQPDNSPEFSCQPLQTLCPPSLLFRFDGNCIPLGMFSALVVKLSQSSWEPDQDSRYRNHVMFHTDGVFPVELLVHPAYLEFHIRIADYSEEDPEEVHQFCMEVRKTVVDTIKLILDLHEHTKKIKFQLGFYCLGSFQADGQPHFSGCLPHKNYTNPKSFLCSKSPRCQDQCRLPHECTIWFEYWKDKKTSRELDHAYNSGCTFKTSADSTHLTLKEIQNELRVVTAAKWYQLGVQLDIPSGMLKTIESNYPCDVQRCMTEVLDFWLRNAPERSWEKLTEAVEAMGGYGVLVKKLRKKVSQGFQLVDCNRTKPYQCIVKCLKTDD